MFFNIPLIKEFLVFTEIFAFSGLSDQSCIIIELDIARESTKSPMETYNWIIGQDQSNLLNPIQSK